MLPCASTAEEVSLAWSDHRISLIDAQKLVFPYKTNIYSGYVQWNPSLRPPRCYGHYFWLPGKTAIHFPVKKNRRWYDHPLTRPIFLAHWWPYWRGSTVLLLFGFFTSTLSIKSGLVLICHLIIDIETLCKTFSLIFILKCVAKFNLKNQIQRTKIPRVPIVQKIMVYFFTSNFLNFCTLLVMLLVTCSRY